MNGWPAVYDDLAIDPDVEFESRLRRQLDAELRSVRVQQFTLPADIEVDIPLSPIPEQQTGEERGGSRRSMIAIAAAIAASICVGVVADRLVVDDDSTPPATVPTQTLPSTTVAPSTTAAPPTTLRADGTDLDVAAASLLSDADHGIAGVIHMSGDGGVRLLTEMAEKAGTACAPFVSTVFEPPVAMSATRFSNEEITFGTVMAQGVYVFSSVKQATDMVDGVRDPRFLADCAPAYITRMAGDVQSAWFPFFPGEIVEPPAIEVQADDAWVGEVTASTMDPLAGPTNATIVIAAVRVGRIVTIVDLMLDDGAGHQLATINDFERIVQKAADRAVDAQPVN